MDRISPELSVIVPTFNEIENVPRLVDALSRCLEDVDWEIIFVDDDSPDGTANRLKYMARKDYRVRCIHRIGRRGLASAVVEGILSSSAPYIAVMDGDLQHDEKLLPKMMQILRTEDTDIAIGSRYCSGGNTVEWCASREKISRFAARISKLAVKADLSDPMSGFFMIKRNAFEKSMKKLSGLGFKILIDIFASSRTPLRFKEIPYSFRARTAGESKLDSHVAWDYGMLITEKWIGRYIPVRFIAFGLIGGLGVLVHLTAFISIFRLLGLDFILSQSFATLIAMVFNYSLNNTITYRDFRKKGSEWFKGLISFTIACSIGAIANVGIASYLFFEVIGWLPASLAGILVGAVWNFAVTKVYTWKIV